MIYRFANCMLDSRLRELTVGGAPAHVEPQVFDVLRYLVENRDRVVSRDDLVEAVWLGRIVSEATIGARIFAARQAVGDTGEAQAVIRTLPRRGFRFVASVNRDGLGGAEMAASSEEGQLSSEAENLVRNEPKRAAWPVIILRAAFGPAARPSQAGSAGHSRLRRAALAAGAILLLLVAAAVTSLQLLGGTA
jgi:DNA-binding winged helix-turn-helix (wHTH) protein